MQQRYGKTQLITDVRSELKKTGVNISVRDTRLFIETVLDCFVDGLIEHKNCSIDKLGRFSIVDNARNEDRLRIRYRLTSELQSLINGK